MEMTSINLRELSKSTLSVKMREGTAPQKDQIMLGAILRIADNVELMAKNHLDLQSEIERLRLLVMSKQSRIDSLESQLKGANISKGKLKAKISKNDAN